jgi:hypothetical protein
MVPQVGLLSYSRHYVKTATLPVFLLLLLLNKSTRPSVVHRCHVYGHNGGTRHSPCSRSMRGEHSKRWTAAIPLLRPLLVMRVCLIWLCRWWPRRKMLVPSRAHLAPLFAEEVEGWTRRGGGSDHQVCILSPNALLLLSSVAVAVVFVVDGSEGEN